MKDDVAKIYSMNLEVRDDCIGGTVTLVGAGPGDIELDGGVEPGRDPSVQCDAVGLPRHGEAHSQVSRHPGHDRVDLHHVHGA